VPGAVITGWGKCLPSAVLCNADLETLTDTSDEWITTRSGIKERRITHVETSDMAAVAGRHALAAAGLGPEDLDLVVLATCTRTAWSPAPPPWSRRRSGPGGRARWTSTPPAAASCTPWRWPTRWCAPGSMAPGAGSGGGEAALLLGLHRPGHQRPLRRRCRAVVVEAGDEEAGLLAFELGADGSAAEILCVPNSGTEGEPSAGRRSRVVMDGPAVFRRAVEAMGDASTRVLQRAGLAPGDVDLLIPIRPTCASSRLPPGAWASTPPGYS